MRRTIIAIPLLTLLVISACTQRTQPAAPGVTVQPKGEVEPERQYLPRIDALIPQMASDDVTVRQESQKTFEMMCLSAARPGAEQERVGLCRQIVRRLGPETPQAARVWMIRQLERVGRDECVAALAELLDDEDPLIRETARRALQHNPSADVRPVLEQALEKADSSEWRIALINALAGRREVDSVGVLGDWATRSEGDVAAVAIAALGDIGGAAAIEMLYELWQRNDPAVESQVTAALLRISERLAESGDRELATQIFDDLYTYSGSEPTRLAALRGLTLAKGPAALAILLEIMQSAEPEMRQRAARLAFEIPGEAVTLTLAMMMFEMPAAVQVTLLEGLGQRGDPTARAAATTSVHSGDREVRIAALHALRNLGNSSDVTLLAQIAAGATGPEQEAARETLARLRGTDVDEAILAAMRTHSDIPLRCELIRAVAARWYRAGIPALFEATKDPVENIQVAAFEALGSLSGVEHLPKLVARLLKEMGKDAREAAENAIVETALRIDDARERVAALLAGLPKSSGAVRVSLIRVLSRIGGSRPLQAIRANYPSLDSDVADAAVRALANWPGPEVLDDLLMIARISADEAHPVLALRGYVRLVRLPSDRTPVETFRMLEEAMTIASRPEEKKLVLGGLADVRHIDALMMADLHLGDEALCDEAAVAMLTIARALAAEQPDAAVAAIRKVQAAPTSDGVHRQAAEAAEFIDRFAGYGAAWLVAGPYMEEGQSAEQLFDIAFPPEAPDAQNVEWALLAVSKHDNPWIFDLAKAVGGGNRCAYVKSEIWSDTQQPARLEIGSDDAVKAWLNGSLVHSNLVYRGVEPAQDKLDVTLNQGWNALTLKIVQGGGAWGFCAGFRAPDGGKLEGLKFRAE